MSITVGQVIRTSARFKNAISGDVVNVYHWRTYGSGTIDDDDVMDAIEAKLSLLYTPLAPVIPSGQDAYDVRHDLVEWANGRETVIRTLGTRSWTLTDPPSGTAEGYPQQDAAVVNLRTAVPKTFGRKYIGTLTESAGSSGVLTSTVLGYLASYATELLTDFTIGGTLSFKAGVLTYKSTVNGNFADFIAAIVQNILCTQRRRRAQRGS